MDGFVMHVFYNEFLYIFIFQLTPMLLFQNFMYVYGEEL